MGVSSFIISGLAILFSIMIHELAHGFTAYYFGDTTAKNDGRLSLNPLRHIDPLGLASLIILKFGWAKPVPVNFSRLKPEKLGAICVALAGCVSNFITAILASILLGLSIKYLPNLDMLREFLVLLINYSLVFGVFNLVPIPPLDGSKVIITFLPNKYKYYAYKYERYFFLILLALAMSGILFRFTGPIVDYLRNFLQGIIYRIVIW